MIARTPRRTLGAIAGLACCLAALGACGSDATAPVPARFRQAEFFVSIEEDLVYGTGAVRSPNVGDLDLLLDLYRPSGSDAPTLSPGLVLIHGGGFTGGTKDDIGSFASLFASRGYVAISIEYRLTGDDPPTESLARDPADPVSVAAAAARVDATQAVAWLRANAAQYGIDPGRVAIGGYSAGAVTAMGVGFRDAGVDGADVDAIVSFSGTLAGTDSIIDANDPPVIMVHGTEDVTVPFADAVDIAARATTVGLTFEFLVLSGVGHDTPFQLAYPVDGVSVMDRITAFLFEHLRLADLTG